MRKLTVLPAILFFTLAASAQFPSGRTCPPFDSTFHYLKAHNLNVWFQGGPVLSGENGHHTLYNSFSMDMHYVPVKYLQVGANLRKKLPAEDDISFWKSYELALYARYTFIRMDCPKIGVYGQAGYTNVVDVSKHNAGKESTWTPNASMGLYKDLGKSFMVQFDGTSYFNERPAQLALTVTWKFMNMKFN
jgi:hypothetical protein